MSDFEKLINASDLIEWIMEAYPDWCVGDVRGIVDHIEALPPAQPEIIRCEECKLANEWHKGKKAWCDAWDNVVFKGDFCSYAERRTDD